MVLIVWTQWIVFNEIIIYYDSLKYLKKKSNFLFLHISWIYKK